MTERLHFHISLSCIAEGNGNPFQCYCLENPRDGGTWWAAIYGVAQSPTRLKRLTKQQQPLSEQEPLRPHRSYIHFIAPVKLKDTIHSGIQSRSPGKNAKASFQQEAGQTRQSEAESRSFGWVNIQTFTVSLRCTGSLAQKSTLPLEDTEIGLTFLMTQVRMDSVQSRTEISGWTSQQSRVKRDTLSCRLIQCCPCKGECTHMFILLNAICQSLDIFIEVRTSSN